MSYSLAVNAVANTAAAYVAKKLLNELGAFSDYINFASYEVRNTDPHTLEIEFPGGQILRTTIEVIDQAGNSLRNPALEKKAQQGDTSVHHLARSTSLYAEFKIETWQDIPTGAWKVRWYSTDSDPVERGAFWTQLSAEAYARRSIDEYHDDMEQLRRNQ